MKLAFTAALLIAALSTSMASARPAHRRVCQMNHHHRVCSMR